MKLIITIVAMALDTVVTEVTAARTMVTIAVPPCGALGYCESRIAGCSPTPHNRDAIPATPYGAAICRTFFCPPGRSVVCG
ncbi:hypothetical protein PGTUg99_033984 [Puccinia graminis f. sp. tritici]|uniref:Uncharacterized protein n=1 Tax=Puccinia graminis f. sp. tritici TaxID=56615 RepID=A0A5B0R8B9_PUCGR|nr:hypothetical protein PGTUg99_033984 [Puccinia graminis f. sp. tritici]